MAKFVVEFVYNVSRAERQAVHPNHTAYLNHLTECGMLLLAGPLVDENGGLLIYEVADRAELRKVLDAEPYVRAGFVAESRIHQWEPRQGIWATTFVIV